MPRKRSDQRGNGEFKPLPRSARNVPGAAGPIPSECPGLLGLLDLCMRQQVYIALQSSSDGGIVGLLILDGDYRARAWCHTAGELRDAVSAQWSRLELAGRT